ncbi:MAG: hypothetical protein JNL61_12560, partial [Rhizobiaceae bacterium]|nr:hypothetical protein [Rhizobiaceae bacterium]
KMSETTQVSVKPVRSFVIRPMNDGVTCALVFETEAGHSGFRVANADIGKLIALIIAEQAKLRPEQAASATAGALAQPLALRALDVAAGADETQILLTADFGGTVLPMAVDRDLLAKTLTGFLQIVRKDA